MQQKTQQLIRKVPVYRRFSIGSSPVGDSPITFLYIGADAQAYRSLSQAFESGRRACTASEALHILEGEKISPRFVVLGHPFNLFGWRAVAEHLSNGPDGESVVLFADTSACTASERQELLSAGLADEMSDLSFDAVAVVRRGLHVRDILSGRLPGNKKPRIETSPGSFSTAPVSAKRILDVMVSLFLLVITLPVMALIALAIKLESRGPVFHNAYRTGKGFRIFKSYRFRTRKVGAEKMIQYMSHLGEHGVTKVSLEAGTTTLGRFLCLTGLAGLPQFFNVLLGNLSLVGNRALPLQEALRLTGDMHTERFDVPEIGRAHV
jgi:lipopolysaccharide/colanic/teichoic acid biosynthesis glycosyltransferase